MFIFTKRVGNNYCILDDQDGSCEWLNNTQVLDAVSKLPIKGLALAPDGVVGNPVRGVINGSMCNWFKGRNLLTGDVSCRSLQRNAPVTFTFSGSRKQKGKKFSGVIDTVTQTGIEVYFPSYNVSVHFAKADFLNAAKAGLNAGLMLN